MADADTFRFSASQVKTFRMCKRKWAWEKVDGLAKPEKTDATQLGTDMHTYLEEYIARGNVPPASDKAGKMARKLIKAGFVPEPGTAEVERPVDLDFGDGLVASGFIDVYQPNVDGRPFVRDHKSTSDLAYMPTREDFKDDPQTIIYAEATRRWTGAEDVDIQFHYVEKKGSNRTDKIRFTQGLTEHREGLTKVLDDAREMREIKRAGRGALSLAPNTSACEAYGGCPYREACKLSDEQRMESLMTQTMTLAQKLAARKAEQAAASAPTSDVGAKLAALAASIPVAKQAEEAEAAPREVALAAPPPTATPEKQKFEPAPELAAKVEVMPPDAAPDDEPAPKVVDPAPAAPSAPAPAPEPTETQRRPRGRPRGSKNLPKPAPTAIDGYEPDEDAVEDVRDLLIEALVKSARAGKYDTARGVVEALRDLD